MNVSNVMRRVQVCHPADSLREAAAKMNRAGLDAMPVVDRIGRLVGLLDRRCLAAADGMIPAPQVGTVMETCISCGRPSDSLSEIDATFNCLGLSHLPIIDEDGYLRGLVSASDLPWRRAEPKPSGARGAIGLRPQQPGYAAG